MATEVRLPKLGKTMEEGAIVEYMVGVGDKVKKGDVIFEIETDKATIEVESPADGFVKHIIAEVGQTLPVAGLVLVLGEKGEKAGADFIKSLKGKATPITPAELPPAPSKQTPPAPKPPQPPASAAEVKLGAAIPLTEKQKITAQKMLQSKREVPSFYLTVRADVTDLVALRTKLNKTGDVHHVRNSIGNNMTQKGKISNGVKISYNDFIMRAIAISLKKFPIMTGRLAGDTIHLADSIGIGLAIFVPDGLVAPVVKNVDKKDVPRIARDSTALAEKARNNKLTPADLEGGCITVSNLGAFGIGSFIPIVVPGQCSILGIGKITDTCVPDNGAFTVRRLMTMTLSVDHRIANGAYAAQFLDFVRKLLEDTSNFA